MFLRASDVAGECGCRRRDVAWSVYLCVCVSVTCVSRAKMAEPIEMPFGLKTKEPLLDGVYIGAIVGVVAQW